MSFRTKDPRKVATTNSDQHILDFHTHTQHCTGWQICALKSWIRERRICYDFDM